MSESTVGGADKLALLDDALRELLKLKSRREELRATRAEKEREAETEKAARTRAKRERRLASLRKADSDADPDALVADLDALLDDLGGTRDDETVRRARRLVADAEKKRKKSMQMPEGPLRSFVEFAGRDDLKGDYHFANRAQRRHASERSNAALARLEAECRYLQGRVDATIKAELTGDAASRLRGVSDQATEHFTRVYRSIYDTLLDSAGKQAKVAYDDAVRTLEAGASGACRQRATSAPALLADALAVAPKFDNLVGKARGRRDRRRPRRRTQAPPAQGRCAHRRKMRSEARRSHDTSRVCDVNRDMIVCDALGDLTDLLRRLAQSKEVSVVRVKDRHNSPPPSMWRDVMVNILLTGDDTRHVCELQLCLATMLTGREGLHGHTLYNRQRCADELLEKLRG